MKEGLETLLEKARSEKLYKIAVIVQSVVKAFYQRKRFLKIKKNNLIIQKYVRVTTSIPFSFEIQGL